MTEKPALTEKPAVTEGPGATEEIVDDDASHRFVLHAHGEEAELVYRRDGRRLVLVHAGVPEAWSGRGIAGRLVEAAVGRALREELVVVPVCSYVRRWLENHPEAVTGLSIEWPPPEPSDTSAPAEDGSPPG